MPLPIISDDIYYHKGEFLFFSKIPRVFIDFQVDETYRVHIADQIMFDIPDNDYELLQKVFKSSSQALTYRVSFQNFEALDCFYLPGMYRKGKTTLEATIEWADRFLNSENLAQSYLGWCPFW